MDSLSPANIFGLAGLLLLVATIVGNPIRRLLLAPEVFEGRTASLALRWLTSAMTGLAVIPLVFLNAGLVPGLAGPGLAWALLVTMLAWNVVIYRKDVVRIREKLAGIPSRLDVYDRAFVILLLGILIFELSPLTGLWTTPGDDAKLYSLITVRFIDTAGIPRTWGLFAPAAWYVEETHLLLPGFASVAASLVYLSGSDVPSTVSILASVFRVLPAATLYLLTFTMTRRRLPALLTMGMYGFLCVEPINGWFQWGGMAELAAISILPIAVAGTLVIWGQEFGSRRVYAWLAALMGGMSLLHPFALFYFLAFLVPFSLWSLLRRDVRRTLRMWYPLAGAFLLAGAPILNALGPEASIAPSYSVYNPAWTPVASWSMDLPGVISSIAWRVVTVYGGFVVAMLALGIILMRETWRRDRRTLAILGLWFAGMVFLHENNPNGLWLAPFPLWYRVDANRTFSVTSFIASIVAALVLEEIVRWLFARSPGSLPSARRRIVRGLEFLRRDRRRSAVLVLLLVMGLAQVYGNATLNTSSRVDAPIIADDVAAFSWIRTQTPATATFFVNWADAGTWIPLFAERRVVLPFGVVTDYALLNSYFQYVSAFASNPSCRACLGFMANMGVQYIYAGPARIYGRQGFDPTRMLATGLFATAYHGGSVWIFTVGSRPVPLTSHVSGETGIAPLADALSTVVGTAAVAPPRAETAAAQVNLAGWSLDAKSRPTGVNWVGTVGTGPFDPPCANRVDAPARLRPAHG